MGNKEKKGKKGGAGFGKFLVGIVVLVAVGGGAMYLFAPGMLQQGLGVVGIELPR